MAATERPARGAPRPPSPVALPGLDDMIQMASECLISQGKAVVMGMGTCRLCGAKARLIRSHIIPRGFYEPMKEGGKVPRAYSSDGKEFPRKSQVGEYDMEILCASCDRALGVWDQYAQEMLLVPLSTFGDPKVIKEQSYFDIDEVDYERLKLFFISVLWRADQSERPFSAHVDLGPRWRQRAKDAILQCKPGEADHFAVLLARYPNERAEKTISSPASMRVGHLNHYRLSLGSYVATIKVDSRSWHEPLGQFMLRPNQPLRVGFFEFEGSGLHQDLLRHVRRRLDSKPIK